MYPTQPDFLIVIRVMDWHDRIKCTTDGSRPLVFYSGVRCQSSRLIALASSNPLTTVEIGILPWFGRIRRPELAIPSAPAD